MTGLRWETRQAWGAAPPLNRRYDVGWKGVVLHWPGANAAFRSMPHSQHQAYLRQWQQQHMARGSNDLEYGSVICPCGIWMEARTEQDKPGVRVGSNGSSNTNYLYTSVQLMVGTSEGITDQEQRWLGEAVAWLRARGWGHELLGHRQTSSTSCPGDAIQTAIPQIAAYASNPPAPEEPPEDPMSQVIFFTYQGNRYAAYPFAGVYRKIPDPNTERSILNSIGRVGGRVEEWHPTKEIDNPAVFGVDITDVG